MILSEEITHFYYIEFLNLYNYFRKKEDPKSSLKLAIRMLKYYIIQETFKNEDKLTNDLLVKNFQEFLKNLINIMKKYGSEFSE